MRQISVRKKRVFYLMMVIITLLLSLLLGEIFARWFFTPNYLPTTLPVRQVDPYKANPYMLGGRPYIHFHNPGSQYIQARSYYRVKYEINSLAFRGPEIPPKTLKRLLIIGDSMVEGHGSEFNDTTAHRLDVVLRPLGWEVINVGVQGGSPIYYAANVDRYLALDPDAVLIILFENDLQDDRILESNFFKLPFFDDNPVLLGQSTWKTYLLHSYLYLVLQRAWDKWYTSPMEAIILHNQRNYQTNEAQIQLNELSPFLVASSLFDKQWALSQNYLDYVVSKLRQQQITVMIASLCLGTIAASPAVFQEHAQNLDKHIQQWATAQQLPFISLLPVIEKAFAKHPVTEIMIPDDGHLTAKGHLILKETLQPWLVKQLP